MQVEQVINDLESRFDSMSEDLLTRRAVSSFSRRVRPADWTQSTLWLSRQMRSSTVSVKQLTAPSLLQQSDCIYLAAVEQARHSDCKRE